MRGNIDSILDRDKKMSEIGASQLNTESIIFKDKARNLNLSIWFRIYGLFIAIRVIILLRIYFSLS